MSQLKKQGVDTQEFEKLSKQLASDVATHVKNLIKIGVIHYSQQQYDEALNVWKQAQVLDPRKRAIGRSYQAGNAGYRKFAEFANKKRRYSVVYPSQEATPHVPSHYKEDPRNPPSGRREG